MMKLRHLALGTALALLAQAAPAGTDTNTLPITATVVNSCKVRSTVAVAFGNYDPADVNLTAPLDQQGTITIQCTKGSNYTIWLNQGTASGATCTGTPDRKMQSGSDVLSYALYQDAARNAVWGCDATNQVAGISANSGLNTINVYGRVPGAQDVPAGAYTDTVTVQVNF